MVTSTFAQLLSSNSYCERKKFYYTSLWDTHTSKSADRTNYTHTALAHTTPSFLLKRCAIHSARQAFTQSFLHTSSPLRPTLPSEHLGCQTLTLKGNH